MGKNYGNRTQTQSRRQQSRTTDGSVCAAWGWTFTKARGKSSTILGLVGDTSSVDIDALNALRNRGNGCKRIQEPDESANRKFHPEDSVIEVGGAKIGGGNFAVIARTLLGGIPRAAVLCGSRRKSRRRDGSLARRRI